MLSVGDIAPDFRVPSSAGPAVSLSEATQTGPVVLHFFPLAFTGGWEQQVRRFQAAYAAFRAAGAEVFGVSTDSGPVLKAFGEHCGAEFAFLSDYNHELVGPYGVRIEEVAGYKGLASRAAFVIGTGRRVLYAFYAPDLGTLPNPDEVLAALTAAG